MPCPEQVPGVMQTLSSQVLVPQHCPELVQGEPLGVQPERPVHTLLLQVRVPQQSEERVHVAPWPEQMPSEQTRFELQVNTPQQSPLLLQTWSRPWHGPVVVTSGMLMSSCLQATTAALSRASGRSRMASRGALRFMGLV
jgi:hypothetical protein